MSFPPPEYFTKYSEETLQEKLRSLLPPPVITKGRYTTFGRSWPVRNSFFLFLSRFYSLPNHPSPLETYYVYQVEDKLDSLEESNMKQLYPKGDYGESVNLFIFRFYHQIKTHHSSKDRVQELKKLNFSALLGFTELVACLVQDSNPVEFLVFI